MVTRGWDFNVWIWWEHNSIHNTSWLRNLKKVTEPSYASVSSTKIVLQRIKWDHSHQMVSKVSGTEDHYRIDEENNWDRWWLALFTDSVTGVLTLQNTTFLYNQMHNLGEFYIPCRFSASLTSCFLTAFFLLYYIQGSKRRGSSN